MAMPVVVQAGFELEPLARKAQIGCGADDSDIVDLAKGLVDHIPGDGADVVRHEDWAGQHGLQHAPLGLAGATDDRGISLKAAARAAQTTNANMANG